MEDVRIAREQYVKSVQQVDGSPSGGFSYGPDGRRVRLIITASGDTLTTLYPSINVYFGATSAVAAKRALSVTPQHEIVLDIDKYGSAIKEQLFINSVDSSASWLVTVTEVFLNDAESRGNPPTRGG